MEDLDKGDEKEKDLDSAGDTTETDSGGPTVKFFSDPSSTFFFDAKAAV